MSAEPKNYDLHSHTIASDGILSPTEVVLRAVENGVDVLAITDHDSTDGLAEAHAAIKTHDLPLKLINGVEISTVWSGLDIHVVGLNVDPNNSQLIELLKNQSAYRIERAKAISAKLERTRIMNAYEGAQEHAKGEIVSRAHFARFLVEKGFVPDIKRAFKKYLGKSGTAYVPPMWCSIGEAVQTIHAAGGQAVLAHPSRYDLTGAKLRKLFDVFKAAGGDGIEVSQSRQSQDDFYMLAKYAMQYQFLASRGSDFHDFNNYLDLGKTPPLSENVQPIWNNW
ncbi:PHP domain-containing protein [Zophobihabitans entericus]|uniref:PHP domain-containing protein n=1 Tax=Zophobihabitans entericus TaxID=1635327 RepID=A0A6G9IE58_9GAMM|nr:PHP domain-containing protein [Zophobihabitans entericus]QIQ22102.1 PHP domain-containing protein [Zophobihabitans entericus]